MFATILRILNVTRVPCIYPIVPNCSRIRSPLSRLTYVGTARSYYYSMRDAAGGKGVENTKTGRWNVSAANVTWRVEKKIGSRAANGCLDALI